MPGLFGLLCQLFGAVEVALPKRFTRLRQQLIRIGSGGSSGVVRLLT
jgi:hypothetical protein